MGIQAAYHVAEVERTGSAMQSRNIYPMLFRFYSLYSIQTVGSADSSSFRLVSIHSPLVCHTQLIQHGLKMGQSAHPMNDLQIFLLWQELELISPGDHKGLQERRDSLIFVARTIRTNMQPIAYICHTFNIFVVASLKRNFLLFMSFFILGRDLSRIELPLDSPDSLFCSPPGLVLFSFSIGSVSSSAPATNWQKSILSA